MVNDTLEQSLAVGSTMYKKIFVKGEITKWLKDVVNLAEIAKYESQLALSVYNVGIIKLRSTYNKWI